MLLINEEKAKSFRNYTVIKYDTYDEEYGLTPEIWRLIDKVRDKFNRDKIQISELEKLIRLYPTVPHFKNSLATTLAQKGQKKRFFEITQQLVEDFPNYVMARCNLASEYTKEKQFEKALELLGAKFDLADLYPARNGGFTEVEIYNYHITILQYLIEIEEDNEAQKHLEFLEYHYPEQMNGNPLLHAFMGLRLEKMRKAMDKERKVKAVPEHVASSDSAPVFTHPEVELFYKTGYNIDKNSIRNIMELPRETLVDDMKKMLIDSIARYHVFLGCRWTEETHSFPVHALIILSSLKAEEGLDAFFTLLRQHEEFLYFWYGDMITEYFWQYAYQIGQHRLDRLKDFLLEPNHYSFARIVASTAVFQIGLHQERRKEEAVEWLKSAAQYLMDHEKDDTLFDTNVFSSILGDLMELDGKKQLPFIEECYQTGLVSELNKGSLESVKERIAEGFYEAIDSGKYEVCETIDQFYKQWERYSHIEEKPLANKKKDDFGYGKQPNPFIAAPKVGRNDPCPCGSGKKYKKCCGAGT